MVRTVFPVGCIALPRQSLRRSWRFRIVASSPARIDEDQRRDSNPRRRDLPVAKVFAIRFNKCQHVAAMILLIFPINPIKFNEDRMEYVMHQLTAVPQNFDFSCLMSVNAALADGAFNGVCFTDWRV
jgi:hypothetical protein